MCESSQTEEKKRNVTMPRQTKDIKRRCIVCNKTHGIRILGSIYLYFSIKRIHLFFRYIF